MTEHKTIKRRRIELLADKPLIRKIISVAEGVGVDNYTLFPVAAGRGRTNSWSDDQLTGATAKQMFMIICDEEHADAFAAAASPLLDDYGLVLIISNVEVLRGGKY
ncbi:MAG: hypothetical protein WA906_00195 [Pacificimonas sp.]